MKAKPRYLNKVSKYREDIGSMIINGKYCDFDSERLKRELSELEIKKPTNTPRRATVAG